MIKAVRSEREFTQSHPFLLSWYKVEISSVFIVSQKCKTLSPAIIQLTLLQFTCWYFFFKRNQIFCHVSAPVLGQMFQDIKNKDKQIYYSKALYILWRAQIRRRQRPAIPALAEMLSYREDSLLLRTPIHTPQQWEVVNGHSHLTHGAPLATPNTEHTAALMLHTNTKMVNQHLITLTAVITLKLRTR